MHIRQSPPISSGFRSCAYTDIEIWADFSDFGKDGFVKFLLCNCSFSAPFGSLGNLFVFVIQTKRHCSENDIETLQKDMIVGMNIGNILPLDVNGLPFFGFGQAKQKTFELLALFGGIGKCIKIYA